MWNHDGHIGEKEDIYMQKFLSEINFWHSSPLFSLIADRLVIIQRGGE